MKNEIRCPIIIIPSIRVLSTKPCDFLNRLNIYGESVFNESNGRSFGLLAFIGQLESSFVDCKYPYLDIKNYKFARYRFLKISNLIARQLISQQIFPSLIISGDPFFGLLAAFRLRRLLKRNIPIQVSFHGELTKIGFGTSIKGRLQNIFVKLTIKKVDSVRLVSEDQIEYALSLFGIDRSKIVIAPVPITSTITWADRPNRKVIGFVGRIHPQRGVGTWVETLSKITFPCEALIIGDGSLRIEMVEKLRLLSHINAKFTGYLAQSEVDEKWNSISVLLSTAPYESYGMAMREAILHGVPVVSIRNSGSQKLFDQCPEMITLVSNSSEAAHAVEHFINNPPPQSASDKFRKDFLAQQKRNLEILAQSWIGNLLA